MHPDTGAFNAQIRELFNDFLGPAIRAATEQYGYSHAVVIGCLMQTAMATALAMMQGDPHEARRLHDDLLHIAAQSFWQHDWSEPGQ